MYNSSSYNDELFDALLTIAFNRLLDEEDAEMPSDEELAEMFPVPQKQVRKMQRYAKRLKHSAPMPIIYLRRFAVACLVILSLAFVTFATVPVVRDAIKETVATWCGKYVQFDFAKADDSKNEITDIYELDIGYIPEGFELVSSIEEKGRREYLYINESREHLVIAIYSTEDTDIMADAELTDYEIVTVNNNDAHLLYNSNNHYGVLILGNNVFSICISAPLDKSSLIMIGNHINY